METAGTVITQMNFITFNEWHASMKHDNCMCDELMIYILSRLHYRHTLIYTTSRPSCTLQHSEDMDITELHSKCDLHLVYLGNNTYGQLKHKPMMPAPPTTVPQLPIINKWKSSRKTKSSSTVSTPIDLSCKSDPTPSLNTPKDGLNQSCNKEGSVAMTSTSPTDPGFNQSGTPESSVPYLIDITNDDVDMQPSISSAPIPQSTENVPSSSCSRPSNNENFEIPRQ